MKKLASIGILASALTFLGCESRGPSNFVEGIVTGEYGTIAKSVTANSELRNTPTENDLDMDNAHYVLKVKTEYDTYFVHVDVDDVSGSKGGHTAYNLAAKIETGTTIRFATKYNGNSLFRNDGLGVVDPDDIMIISDPEYIR